MRNALPTTVRLLGFEPRMPGSISFWSRRLDFLPWATEDDRRLCNNRMLYLSHVKNQGLLARLAAKFSARSTGYYRPVERPRSSNSDAIVIWKT
jgi:hypothetical protein